MAEFSCTCSFYRQSNRQILTIHCFLDTQPVFNLFSKHSCGKEVLVENQNDENFFRLLFFRYNSCDLLGFWILKCTVVFSTPIFPLDIEITKVLIILLTIRTLRIMFLCTWLLHYWYQDVIVYLSGLQPEFWGPVYSASKHAVVGLVRSWAVSFSLYYCSLFVYTFLNFYILSFGYDSEAQEWWNFEFFAPFHCKP